MIKTIEQASTNSHNKLNSPAASAHQVNQALLDANETAKSVARAQRLSEDESADPDNHADADTDLPADADEDPKGTLDRHPIRQAVKKHQARNAPIPASLDAQVSISKVLEEIQSNAIAQSVAGSGLMHTYLSLVERNTMRYFLALEAYVGILASPSQTHLEQRMQDWRINAERNRSS